MQTKSFTLSFFICSISISIILSLSSDVTYLTTNLHKNSCFLQPIVLRLQAVGVCCLGSVCVNYCFTRNIIEILCCFRKENDIRLMCLHVNRLQMRDCVCSVTAYTLSQ